MVVYADILLCVNGLVDYFLLLVTAALCGEPKRRGRLAAAAGIGALFSLTLLLPRLPALAVLLCRAVCAWLCCRIAFGQIGPRRILRCAAALFCGSALFAGLLLLVQRRGGAVTVGNGSFYADISPVMLIALACGFYLLLSLGDAVLRLRAGDETATLSVSLGQRSIVCRCLLDSGNALRDPISGKRVIVLRRGLAPQLLAPPQRAALDAFFGGAPPTEAAGLRLIPCSTVSGAGVLPGFSGARCCITRRAESDRPDEVFAAFCRDELLGAADAVAYRIGKEPS